MSSIIIRKCTIPDFDYIYALLKQLWPNLELHVDTIRDIFNQKINSENDTFFCVESESKVIGFLAFSVQYNFSRQGKYGFIGEFIIDKGYRDKGIGTDLLNKVIEYAKDKGCSSIELTSSLYRTGAHEFFLKSGFEKRAFLFSKELK
jgi:ribosomal protein S18 acetylase RimI-like enzyme